MNKKLVIIINGRGASGKDTCIKYLRGFKTMNVSSIDIIKKAAKILGWNGVKTASARKFLSELKKLSVEFNEYPNKYIMSIYNGAFLKSTTDIMFIHVREPEEIEKLKNNIPGAITLLVKRDLIGDYGNESDDNVENYDYDVIFENNDTLEKAKVNFNKLIADLYNKYAH